MNQRRDEIIAATLEQLSTTPANQLSIDDIAEAAGASRALIYHYFRNKEQLYVAAVRSGCADLKSRLTLPDVHPFEQLRWAAQAYLDFAEERSAVFVGVLRGAGSAGQPDELASIIEDVRLFIVDLITTSLGIREPSPVLRATLRGWVAMIEMISLDWLDKRTLSRKQVRRLLVNHLGAVLAAAAADDPVLADRLAELVATADPRTLSPWVASVRGAASAASRLRRVADSLRHATSPLR